MGDIYIAPLTAARRANPKKKQIKPTRWQTEITRRARFAGSGCPAVYRNNLSIPRSSSNGLFGISRLEHQTVLPAPYRVTDRTGRSLDWAPEAPFGFRCTAGYPDLRIERAYYDKIRSM